MASNVPITVASWSSTASSNQPDTTDLASTLREDLQAIQAGVRLLRSAGSISSAATTNLASVNEEIVTVSGTATITSLGTVSAGMIKVLVFSGAATLTHDGTALILPGASNIALAAGDIAAFLSLGSGNWRCLWYQPAAGYLSNTGGTVDGVITQEVPDSSFNIDMMKWITGQVDPNFYLRVMSGANSNADASVQAKLDFAYSGVASVCGINFLRGAGTGAGYISFTTAGTEKFRIATDGQLRSPRSYNATSANAANVYVDSSGDIWRATSIRASKTSISPLSDSGAIIDALRPVSYESLLDSCRGATFWGLIAEDCAEVARPLATFDQEGKPDNIDDRAHIALLIAEVKSLRARVAALESR